MAKHDNITPELLRQLLEHNPETGLMYWKPRSVDLFADSTCNGGTRTADWSCRRWNTRYANTEALASIDTLGYKAGRINNIGLRAHRVIWALHYGEWPKYVVDHINGDRTDNRIANLRDVPQSENVKNSAKPVTNKSGHIGVVSAPNGKWIAQIGTRANPLYLGTFNTKQEAIHARGAASAERGFHQNHGR